MDATPLPNIDAEFLRMHPNSDTFLEKVSSFYVPRILRYMETKWHDLLVPSNADFSGKDL